MRRSLFKKYFVTLLIGSTLPLLVSGATERPGSRIAISAPCWTSYCKRMPHPPRHASEGSSRVEGTIWTGRCSVTGAWAKMRITNSMLCVCFAKPPPSSASPSSMKRGMERLFVSRVELNRRSAGADRSRDPAVIGARDKGVWFGPVTYSQGSEPFMVIAVSGRRKAKGVAVAEINLKLIWEVVSTIRVGQLGHAII